MYRKEWAWGWEGRREWEGRGEKERREEGKGGGGEQRRGGYERGGEREEKGENRWEVLKVRRKDSRGKWQKKGEVGGKERLGREGHVRNRSKEQYVFSIPALTEPVIHNSLHILQKQHTRWGISLPAQ